MKKSVSAKAPRSKFKLKSNTIIIGVVVIVIIIALFFILKSGGIKNLSNISRNEFTITNVYQDISKDFPNKEIPMYDDAYCKKKYAEKYSKNVGYCTIINVKTLARLNPVLTEVTCSCN